jgi:polysaccharide biosynthesis protein PslG
MIPRIFLHLGISISVLASVAAAPPRGIPPQVIPQPFGVNIHFVNPNPAEADALAAVGYRIVRMDFSWGGTERVAGEYDFAGYDRLVGAMSQRQIRCLFILDYAHGLYDQGLPPHTDEGRAAFAKWAAAAAKHFAGKGIIWELWNEPNIVQFWKPAPNADDYAKLAEAVIAAVRAADADAFIVGPATSTFPWAYFQTLADRGVLAKFDAISVHPYRQTAPETAGADYARLRALLDRASPNKKLPILSGEWGYSTGWRNMTEEKQAQYLVRQWLFNLSNDIGLSIWYDWKDDGDNPTEPEHHFGSVYRDLKPKPATKAAHTLASTLTGYHFVRRLPAKEQGDFVLLLEGDGKTAIAAWTTGAAHTVSIAMPDANVKEVKVVEMLGGERVVRPANQSVSIEIGASPQYLMLIGK